jgi:hypothetical protein
VKANLITWGACVDLAQPFGFGLPGWPAGGVTLGRGAFGAAGFGAGVAGLG